MTKDALEGFLGRTFRGFDSSDRPASVPHYEGKVRDVFDLGDDLIITTSDRISAFDRVLDTIPCKGEVLNRLALYWFDQTKDIIDNHIIDRLTARTIRCAKCDVLPVEVIVRGYVTGSAWRDYQAGKAISGITLEPGLKMNQRLPKPILTPSTKEDEGHDQPISSEEIVAQGLVDPKIWAQVEETAMALFARGTELAAKQGLILVDTKYEFGLRNGKLVLVDEIHTPDSSRFWYSDTYEELFAAGEKQKKVDKEFLRQWLMEKGFMGDGEAPVIPDEVKLEVAMRYITAFETITGEAFEPQSVDEAAEKSAVVSAMQPVG